MHLISYHAKCLQTYQLIHDVVYLSLPKTRPAFILHLLICHSDHSVNTRKLLANKNGREGQAPMFLILRQAWSQKAANPAKNFLYWATFLFRSMLGNSLTHRGQQRKNSLERLRQEVHSSVVTLETGRLGENIQAGRQITFSDSEI
jgi:hypothetical protein